VEPDKILPGRRRGSATYFDAKMVHGNRA
jgi:hypothetical protein